MTISPAAAENDLNQPQLSVVIPARNEAGSIRDCLASLVKQSEDDFSLGRDWELIVVDDASTDATSQIAAGFSGVTVLQAPPLDEGWTGKTNALWFAAQQARGTWLLFTDADTVHEPGDLRRAIHEAERYKVALLSYSPRQLVRGVVQRTLMALIFADLAQTYPPRLVNLPDSRLAAANGQFILIRRNTYMRVGGHKAVRGSLIEDMELARHTKHAGESLRLRFAADAASTRMYASLAETCAGWRKNLALLLPDALSRGLWKLFQATLLFGLPLLAIWMYLTVSRTPVIWAMGLWWAWRVRVHYANAAKAHFPLADVLLSPLALPLYAWLLIDSWMQRSVRHKVIWKGREYKA
ncbi:MAG TPA: glycosyltransferase family 2 protein [Acidobacteriaceae bacterium]|nr:glycosyltransferase family 2 protein [Acidobacteriaceae bacterium]